MTKATHHRFEIGDRVVTIPLFCSLSATVVDYAERDRDGSLVYWVRFDGHVGVNPDGSPKISKLLERVARPLPKQRTFTLDDILNGSV